jgi:glycosidase
MLIALRRSRLPGVSWSLLTAFVLVVTSLAPAASAPAAQAAPASAPTSVTIAGDLQSELGCPGDWQPDCAATHLTYDASDDVWQGTFNVPAGSWQYKAALNDSWNENYGQHAAPGGANIPLNLAAPTSVKFYYDNKSHWVTDNQSSVIATVPGSFQSELGCPGDWQPDCLRSWLQDPDGDGIYRFETTSIPQGSYEAKVALNESWNVNYGQGGVQNGANIPFLVPANGAKVIFVYDSNSHVLTIQAGHGHDNNVEWNGLGHDSRDLLYRTPGGAVPAGTPVKVRFRTFHDDVTAVQLRVYDLNTNSQSIIPMKVAAADVSCYQAALANDTCDFWEATLNPGAPNNPQPDNLWYRFIVHDGSATAYYADDTPALDGGLGAPTADVVDNSYALMFYTPGFSAPNWASGAVIYQIFPDRFRNGRASNDPHTGDPRYADPVLSLPWGTLPEGYCRNYADAATSCPWRFDPNPPVSSPTIEQPRGRDYMGGDLKGVDQELDYLQALGVNTLYFNPIFDSASDHGYDTQDYTKIDPYFGTQKDWDNLVKHANQLGIRIILDGVFNHLSSDSPFFDRYHHFDTVGACESASSPYRSWFHFRPPTGSEPSVCAPSTPGGNDTFYDGWFGFDSIPVLQKSVPAVQQYFLTGPNNISQLWLNQGASGWRLDVMGDPSFPKGYWETFRTQVKQTNPRALIVGELWQKDSTLLRFLRGDRADSTMDYRLRDAVLGFLAPGNFDPKGFADSGHPLLPSQFLARLASIREDTPDAAYYSLMNLVDSHDTERVLWTLTPGKPTRADKEQNAANVAAGKQRLRLASLIQFTLPGAPTIYYGDEVGLTGDTDPDTRRTYPWPDLGGSPDTSLLAHYTALSQLRQANPVLTAGDFRSLLADDTAKTAAYSRKTGNQAALVAFNNSDQTRTLNISLAGVLPDGVTLTGAFGVGNSTGQNVTVSGGMVSLSLNALSGLVLLTQKIDLTPPAAPGGLHVNNEGNAAVSLGWNAVGGAASYNVYRSPVSGGGGMKANASPIAGTTFDDGGLQNARTYYYIARALDAAGNESGPSNEVSAVPHYVIGWANLQWPPTLTHVISAVNRTDNVYGQVWIDGVTNQPGATPSLAAQLGFGPEHSNPAGNPGWTWVDAGFNTDAGNNDEFVASLLPDSTGNFDYLYRYTTTNGRDWLYADQNGPIPNGALPPNPGKLTVQASSDTTAPGVPAGLHVIGASPTGVELGWDANVGDPTLYGYEVRRNSTAGGPYTTLALVTGTSYQDLDVQSNATYYYVVRAVDTSFNRSGNSAEVAATAALRTVHLTFSVTVPASTDGTGRSVYIAGFLDRLDGGLPQWDPGGVALTRVDATHWTINLTGKETTQIEYKYTLGDWDHVEKDASCGEISNRQLTLSYGSNGNQVVNDTVLNWRNVALCGN